jgi:hypothetical protein
LQSNCCSACGEDRAFEDDGEATIWFEPVDPGERERTEEDDQRNMKGDKMAVIGGQANVIKCRELCDHKSK